jgi:gluconokinase
VIVVMMGVTGSGKTTIGRTLAAAQKWKFAEGDDYHSAANRQKMHAGIPLTDEDRAPWLDALHAVLLGWHRDGVNGVMACSALRQSYREHLAAGIPPQEIRFVLLEVPKQVLEQRLAVRQHHYMSPLLLDSQLATLEKPQDAFRVSGVDAPATIIANILAHLR